MGIRPKEGVTLSHAIALRDQAKDSIRAAMGENQEVAQTSLSFQFQNETELEENKRQLVNKTLRGTHLFKAAGEMKTTVAGLNWLQAQIQLRPPVKSFLNEITDSHENKVARVYAIEGALAHDLPAYTGFSQHHIKSLLVSIRSKLESIDDN